MLIAGALLRGAIWLIVLYFLTGEQIAFTIRLLCNIVAALRSKTVLPPVQATEEDELETWEEPSDNMLHNNNNTSTKTRHKIIWGFWHSGEEALPGFCQLAVKSWRVHHPEWKIIILSDSNYKQYVSPSDLPSTYASLKVQFRSDLIRLAVLRRYGGLYLDASYTIFRAFDNIWTEAAARNDLYLTSLVTLQDGFRFPNNCFILAPQPQNPVLVEWQHRCIAYLEDPCLNATDAPRHPMLRRVARHFTDPGFGALSVLVAYFGVIWNLTDVLYYEESLREYVQEHVWILPSFRWTFDHVMIKCITMSDKAILHGESFDEGWISWLARVPNGLRIMFMREPDVIDRQLQFGMAMKTSSDFYPYFEKPISYHIERKTSAGLIYRASVDKQFWPLRQADTVGARRVASIPAKSKPLGGAVEIL